jgi:hypothetical protein
MGPNPRKIILCDNSDVDDLKREIKEQLQPAFDSMAHPYIVVRVPQGDALLWAWELLANISAAEPIGTVTSPYLVDAPEPEQHGMSLAK